MTRHIDTSSHFLIKEDIKTEKQDFRKAGGRVVLQCWSSPKNSSH